MIYNQLINSNRVISEILCAVLLHVIQKVSVVNHYAAGISEAPGGRVSQPVHPIENSSVPDVKVCHRIQSLLPSFSEYKYLAHNLRRIGLSSFSLF